MILVLCDPFLISLNPAVDNFSCTCTHSYTRRNTVQASTVDKSKWRSKQFSFSYQMTTILAFALPQFSTSIVLIVHLHLRVRRQYAPHRRFSRVFNCELRRCSSDCVQHADRRLKNNYESKFIWISPRRMAFVFGVARTTPNTSVVQTCIEKADDLSCHIESASMQGWR